MELFKFTLIALAVTGCSATNYSSTGSKKSSEQTTQNNGTDQINNTSKGEVDCTDLTRAQCEARKQEKVDELKKNLPPNTPVDVSTFRKVECPTATKEDPNCQALVKKQNDLDAGLGSDIRTQTCSENPAIAGCTLDGGSGTITNLGLCASSAVGGVRPYSRCGANEVLIVVNDGVKAEMTCCPLSSNSILSSNPAELNVRRSGACGADEVGTGMESPSPSVVYCSKLNTSAYAIGRVSTSQYVNRSTSWLSPELRTLVGMYHDYDTCACQNGGIFSGGHSATDNNCTDRCVEIIKK